MDAHFFCEIDALIKPAVDGQAVETANRQQPMRAACFAAGQRRSDAPCDRGADDGKYTLTRLSFGLETV
jgi:hypothetical protein